MARFRREFPSVNSIKKPPALKSRLVLSGHLLVAASMSNAAYLRIPILSSSYNADAIVESNATPRLDVVTTATV
jgi:hypothetical protein